MNISIRANFELWKAVAIHKQYMNQTSENPNNQTYSLNQNSSENVEYHNPGI